MAFYRESPSDANTLKIITIYICFHTEFVSVYYNDEGNAFIYPFGQYTRPYMK